MTLAPPPYTLVRHAAAGGAPLLDPGQRAVVAHRGGPLLVLAGPGTGKTTTLVEAVLDRMSGEGAVRPEEILVLTFSRAAAAELRDRIGARLGETVGVPGATTFHSFCFALLGRFKDPTLFSEPLRLLSGPEQDVVIRELVRGTIDPLTGWQAPSGSPDAARWPAALRAALGTRGFAEELRAVLLRAREQGLDPARLREFAERADREDWRAAARFFAEYLDVTDARGVLDYAELVHRAVLLAETSGVREQLRSAYRVVFVDEYQDTDPAQVRLLEALAGDGRELVVVGDPDQSIYAFRGADLHGILEFPDRFRTNGGEPAPIAVLRTSRRSGPTLLRASRRAARRMPLTRLPAEKVREHRDLQPGEGVPADGSVSVLTFPTTSVEQAALADLLRRAHLEEGVDWADMAVLTRTGSQLSSLRRALTSGNVPVEVHADQLPLAREPAVATLLLALRCAADPSALTPDTARTLLTGPLAGLDSGDLRRLGRALRAEESLAGGGAALPRPADQLIREAVAEPSVLAAFEPSVGGAARDLALVLRAAAETLADGGVVEDALRVLCRVPGPVAASRRSRLRGRPARGPRPRRGHRAFRAGGSGPGADRARGRHRLHQRPAGAGHSGRHARRQGRTRRRGAADDGSRVEGPAVGARRRRRGAGGVMAGPAASRLAARRRPDRAARSERPAEHERSARRRAAPVLRGRHTCSRTPRRQRGARRGRGRRDAVPLHHRARRRAGHVRLRAPAPAAPDRPARRAAPVRDGSGGRGERGAAAGGRAQAGEDRGRSGP